MSFTGKPTKRKSKTFDARRATLPRTSTDGIFDDLEGDSSLIRVHVRHGRAPFVTHVVPYGSPVSRVARPGFRYYLSIDDTLVLRLPLTQRLLDASVRLVGVEVERASH